MFRIIKYPKGWVVEIQKTKWYGEKYWTHFISVAGIESEPWYYKTFDYAFIDLENKVKLIRTYRTGDVAYFKTNAAYFKWLAILFLLTSTAYAQPTLSLNFNPHRAGLDLGYEYKAIHILTGYNTPLMSNTKPNCQNPKLNRKRMCG